MKIGESPGLASRCAEVERVAQLLMAWAATEPQVRALGIVGSWARGAARLDSDVDIMLLSEHPEHFTGSDAWLEAIGDGTLVRRAGFGVITERRIRLPSGLELEFGIGPLSWARTDPVDPGTRQVVRAGMRALHDPDGLLARLQTVAGTNESVRIVPYDRNWPVRFEEERLALEQTLGDAVTGGIHHVGSTAVPGLAAKPVIDILVGIDDLERARAHVRPLAELGYLHAAYRPAEMIWFCKPDPARRTHHLHLVPTGSRRYREELAFRDFLRAHPKVAERYATLKRQLAAQYGDDREAYTVAKAEFIRDIVGRAAAEGAG